MSQHGEAAEQVVDMATNMTVKGVEVVANLTGKGAVSLATFLIAALKEQTGMPVWAWVLIGVCGAVVVVVIIVVVVRKRKKAKALAALEAEDSDEDL